MKQAIELNFVEYRRGEPAKRPFQEALDFCRRAGFSQVDYLSPINRDDYLDEAKRRREQLEASGMKVLQSHCPFFRYQENGQEKFREAAPKAVLAAAALGSRFLVIHADEYRPPDGAAFDPEDVLAKTEEYLAPVIDLCVKNGIRPAIENLFEENPAGPRSRYTHFPTEVISVIEAFPGSGIGCCWDSGHLNVSSGDESLFLENLKILAPHIICTHIHDNRYGIDMHKPPYFGSIPWEEVMKILKENRYAGELCWEFVYERIPDELYADYLHFVHATGEYLIRKFDEAD